MSDDRWTQEEVDEIQARARVEWLRMLRLVEGQERCPSCEEWGLDMVPESGGYGRCVVCGFRASSWWNA